MWIQDGTGRWDETFEKKETELGYHHIETLSCTSPPQIIVDTVPRPEVVYKCVPRAVVVPVLGSPRLQHAVDLLDVLSLRRRDPLLCPPPALGIRQRRAADKLPLVLRVSRMTYKVESSCFTGATVPGGTHMAWSVVSTPVIGPSRKDLTSLGAASWASCTAACRLLCALPVSRRQHDTLALSSPSNLQFLALSLCDENLDPLLVVLVGTRLLWGGSAPELDRSRVSLPNLSAQPVEQLRRRYVDIVFLA